MMTRVSVAIGVSGKQLQTHTTVGRLNNSTLSCAGSMQTLQANNHNLTYISDTFLSFGKAGRAENTARKTDLALHPFAGRWGQFKAHAWRGSPVISFRMKLLWKPC